VTDPTSIDPFGPPESGWTRVSPKLALARRIVLLLIYIPVQALLLVGAYFWAKNVDGIWWVFWSVLAVGLIFFVWAWWYLGRRARSWGYAERADDLLVTRGILMRRLVIVPYGRMQLVDVQAGPIDRALGLARVQLHTAAATTDASIPGLTPEVAAALRDQLAALGEQRSAGL
jgi:membrane protein YdbS with pleckstrin-like domain